MQQRQVAGEQYNETQLGLWKIFLEDISLTTATMRENILFKTVFRIVEKDIWYSPI